MTPEFKLAIEIIVALIGLPCSAWIFARTLSWGIAKGLKVFAECIANPITEALKDNAKQESRFHAIETDVRDLKKEGKSVVENLEKLTKKIDSLVEILITKKD